MRILSKATPLTAAVILLGGFTAGWAVGGSAFANQINLGVVAALSDVGQVLFGAAVFDAVDPVGCPTCIHNQNAVANQGAATSGGQKYVRMDFADNSAIPAAFNVFHADQRPAACKSYLQVMVIDGQAVVMVDDSAAPAGFNPQIVHTSLADEKPATTQCPAVPASQ